MLTRSADTPPRRLDQGPAETTAELPTPAAHHGASRSALRLALPAIALGSAAALVGLDRRSMWLDEAFTVGSLAQLADTVQGTGGTMAAYYALLTPWAAISDTVWWLRLLSVVLVVASLVPLAGVARRIGGTTLAVRATVAVALAAQATRYAQEARSYGLVLLLATSSWALLLLAVETEEEDRRRRIATALAVLAVVSVLAHGLAVLNVLALAVAAAMAPARSRALRTIAPAVAMALAVVGTLLLGGANEVGSWVPPLTTGQLADAVRAYTSPSTWAAVPLAAVAVVGAVASWRTSPEADPMAVWQARLPVVWAAVPTSGLLVLSVVRPSFDDRYLVAVLPAVGLLLARATTLVDARRSRGSVRVVGPAALVVLALLIPGQVHVHREVGDDWRGAVDVVAAGTEAGDGLTFPVAFHRLPFEQAWAESGMPQHSPTPVDSARALGEVRRVEVLRTGPQRRAALRAHSRLWVITASEPGVPDVATAYLEDLSEIGFEPIEDVELGGSVRVVLLGRR